MRHLLKKGSTLVCCLLLCFSVLVSSFVPSQNYFHGKSLQEIGKPKPFPWKTTSSLLSELSMSSDDAIDDSTPTDELLEKLDTGIVARLIRVGNHIPTLLTLYYFGLISMSSMMGQDMQQMATGPATLSSVLTKNVGTTSNQQFSTMFPTLVTPANPVFLIWPFIAVTQIITLAVSALSPSRRPLLSQGDLTSLSLANLFATFWLILSSKSSPGMLPLGCFLLLPLVPLFSGYPLRNKEESSTSLSLSTFIFQVYSSFTALASFLALAVEVQHGGRVPRWLARPELSALLFLWGSGSIVTWRENGIVKRVVNCGALTGILVKRVMDATAGGGSFFSLFRSLSFFLTVFVTFWSCQAFFDN